MTTVFQQFDDTKRAFINPEDFINQIDDFPQICITTFSENIINRMVKSMNVTEIAKMYSSNGVLPVYRTHYKGKAAAFYLSRVGAPACVAGMEEIIAYGAKKIVMFGCCGILNDMETKGKIIVPTSAVRDEGTSYHYVAAGEEIQASQRATDILVNCLDRVQLPYVKGKIWTTDAIYRETKKMIAARKEQGCLAVEMECSAAMALAAFRNIPFIPFLFGADSLDGDNWDARDLTDYGDSAADKYIELAFECGFHM